MPWARIDDSLYDHPKLDELGSLRLSCMGLWVLALSWSNRYLTDGYIPADRVRKLGANVAMADRLVAAGLWEKVDTDYRIHDFLEFSEPRATVKQRRLQMREMGKRGGEASGQARRFNRDASTMTSTGASSGTVELPSSPVHTYTRNPPTPHGLKTREERPESLGTILSRATKEGRS